MTEPHIAELYFGQKDKKILLAEWYDELHRHTFGIGSKEAMGVTADLHTAFSHWLDSGLRKSVCIDWRYCEKKKSLGKTATLASTVADFFMSTCGLNTNGAVCAAVLFVQYGFDAICNCPE